MVCANGSLVPAKDSSAPTLRMSVVAEMMPMTRNGWSWKPPPSSRATNVRTNSSTTTMNRASLTARVIATANGVDAGARIRSCAPRTRTSAAITTSAIAIAMNMTISAATSILSSNRGTLPRTGGGSGSPSSSNERGASAMTVPRCGRERAVRPRPPRGVLPAASREHATPGRAGGEMSCTPGGGVWGRLTSRGGSAWVTNFLGGGGAAVTRGGVMALRTAGGVGAWVPATFWQHLFLTSDPLAGGLWGPVIGPVISVLSFVCSIGKVPLAAVLWNGGISFGGVGAFIFADLIIIPILVIYPKYYGTKMMLVLLGIFYATMVAGGYIIEFLFGGLWLIPAHRTARVAATAITWNYATYLNIIFVLIAAALLVRFFRSGGTPCST